MIPKDLLCSQTYLSLVLNLIAVLIYLAQNFCSSIYLHLGFQILIFYFFYSLVLAEVTILICFITTQDFHLRYSFLSFRLPYPNSKSNLFYFFQIFEVWEYQMFCLKITCSFQYWFIFLKFHLSCVFTLLLFYLYLYFSSLFLFIWSSFSDLFYLFY